MSMLSLPIQEAQKTIFRHFSESVQQNSADIVLAMFRQLFIDYTDHSAADLSMTLYTIVMGQQQIAFEQTLIGVCHILINTWQWQHQPEAIAELWQCLTEQSPSQTQLQSQSLGYAKRLQSWLQAFVDSQAFAELRQTTDPKNLWYRRYRTYLLTEQSLDSGLSPEQQASARLLAQQLKDQFQLELAKYVSVGQRQGYGMSLVDNPTALGDAVIPLIKRILLRRDHFSYEQLALRFCKQTAQMNYGQFKQNLLRYLSFALRHPFTQSCFQAALVAHLAALNPELVSTPTSQSQIFQTCRYLVDVLTTTDQRQPTPLFIQGITQGNPLGMAVLLLKIVLICPSLQSHVDWRMAGLIHAYESKADQDCQEFINFLEIFRITFAIYQGHQHYTLVKVKDAKLQGDSIDLAAYRIFAQRRAG